MHGRLPFVASARTSAGPGRVALAEWREMPHQQRGHLMPLHAEQSPIAQFKTPKLQAVWSRKTVPRASWRFIWAGFYFRENPRRLHVVFGIKSILLTGLLLAIAGYLAAATAVYATWSQSPHNRVAYHDLLLPFRWKEARALRGGDLVAEGLGELKRQRYATAVLLLGKGVGMNPAEQRGRLELATLFMRLGYLHRARQLLEEGLNYPPVTKTYYQLYFVLTGYMEDHEAVLAGAAKLEPSADAAARRDFAGHRARALLALERYDDLEALRASFRDAPLVSIEVAWARGAIKRGRADLALTAIAADPLLFGITDERRDLEARAALAANDRARAERVLAEWLADRPIDAGPRQLEVLVAARWGGPAKLREALDRYYLYFGSKATEAAQILLRLAEASTWENVILARTMALEYGAYHPIARMAYVEALMVRGRFAEAETELEATRAAMAAANFFPGSWPEGMRRIIDACVKPTPSTQALLTDFLTNERASPAGFHLALNALAQSRAQETLRDLYTLAKLRYPGLTPSAETRARIEAAQVAQRRPVAPPTKTSAPKPAAPKADVAAVKPGSTETAAPARRPATAESKAPAPALPRKEALPPLTERAAKALLTRAQEQVDAGRQVEALATLEKLARPDLPDLTKDVLMLRARCHAELRSYDALRSTMWLLLRERPVNLPELRRLVERCRERQLIDSALIILRETVESAPEAKWAGQMLRDIEGELKTDPDGPKG